MKKFCFKNCSKKTKTRIIVGFILFGITLIMLFLNYVVNPVIIQLTESKVRSLTQKAIESAIFEIISDTAIYDSLINIVRNDDGDVAYITTNSLEVNMISREIIKMAQNKVDEMGAEGVSVPIGSFTGLPIFANRGPAINIKLLPIGSISARFNSEFYSAGINQTNHMIYLIVDACVSIILPTTNQKVNTKTEIMMSESIIVGDIPSTYLNSDNLDEMLNLTPSN